MSKPIIMWAAIVNLRGEWINPHTIRATKRASRAEYIRAFDPDYLVIALARVRFARVEVKEIT